MKDQRLYQTVARQIRALIDEGAFPPGSRLPGERELAERFDVSRVTVREAEIALQAQGFIQIKTGSGVYVCDQSERGEPALPPVSAFEVTEARLLFESEAAGLAATQISDDTINELEQLVERMVSGDPVDDDVSDADQEFHRTIAQASGNTAVQHVVESLWQMRTEIDTVREVHDAICSDETAEDRGDEHRAILNALRDRDPQAARKAMQAHFRRLLESMIDVTEEQALRELREKTSASRQRFLRPADL